MTGRVGNRPDSSSCNATTSRYVLASTHRNNYNINIPLCNGDIRPRSHHSVFIGTNGDHDPDDPVGDDDCMGPNNPDSNPHHCRDILQQGTAICIKAGQTIQHMDAEAHMVDLVALRTRGGLQYSTYRCNALHQKTSDNNGDSQTPHKINHRSHVTFCRGLLCKLCQNCCAFM